jgi:hypothetical protein
LGAGLNAGLDAGLNTGLDARLNAGLDAGLNTGLDARLNAGLDGRLNAGLDRRLNARLLAAPDAWIVVVLYRVLVLVTLGTTRATAPPAALDVATALAAAEEEDKSDEDDVPKISFCAPVMTDQARCPNCNQRMEASPSLKPHLLLYAGLLEWPLWSLPLTAMLFPSA